MSLPAALTLEERHKRVTDHERGRAHLMFTMTMKLSAIQEPPLAWRIASERVGCSAGA